MVPNGGKDAESLMAEHEPRYFAAAEHLSDAQLAGFSSKDICQVRVAHSAYGLHLFGKVRIPSLPEDGPAYIHFRAFKGGPEGKCSLHSIRMDCLQPSLHHSWDSETSSHQSPDIEEKPSDDRTHSFRAIFARDDLLEWFDT